uniref:Cytochrome b5 n=1 Tax=Diabrotica virgifera virgifera TaxID=50390 RepID=A0A6P7FB53_DIAVI
MVEDKETKYFTLEEIAKHNGKQGSSVWIIIKDNVYDVTDFMEEHPGGAELIMEWAGQNATNDFDNFGHSLDAKRDLKKLKIGEVDVEERKKKINKEPKVKSTKITSTNDTKLYNVSEVAKHDGIQDTRTWIIIKNCVYDVTEYMEEHPGSADVIREWAGKDATKAFDNIGHSTDAKRILKKLKIGEIPKEDKKKNSDKITPIHQENKENINNKEANTKFYSYDEISRHNGKDNPRVWIVIRDAVYDVTDYLEEHPGGAEVIKDWAGKDATKEFDSLGHSSDAKNKLKKLKIGEVVNEERKKKLKKVELNRQISIQKIKILDSSQFVNRKSCISILTCGILC